MFAGLDFGTSNSALGVWIEEKVKLLALSPNELFLPSTLYTYDRSLICDYLYRNLPQSQQANFKKLRLPQLRAAAVVRDFEGLEPHEQCNFFGQEAIHNYVNHPEEGLFIKSPKSFLGATGLSQGQIDFFEDLVSAMILNIKLKAEAQLKQSIDHVVIGRPVNFQGVNSQKSNQQAIQIMTQAALRCGYKNVEFLYEPLAAGIDFESELNQDQIVLVVDIGGGTTDCSMVKMGPSYVTKDDRSSDFLAHTGQRVGGNDFDIVLAYQNLMPLFGRGSLLNNSIELPDAIFWNAVSINNVAEQTKFASQPFVREVKRLQRDAIAPALLQRLLELQASKQNHRLVRGAELAKIGLSDDDKVKVDLDYIEQNLSQTIYQINFESAVKRPLGLIKKLIANAISDAAVKPQLIYITGGSAKSPTVRKAISEVAPDVPILDGDYYGSVAAGLTKWANKIWS